MVTISIARRPVGPRSRILGLALGSVVVLAGVAAPPASGSIKIYESSEDATLLGKIKSGSCSVKGKGAGKHFRVSARSVDRKFDLEVTILDWGGYGKKYTLRYGTNRPAVFYLDGPKGPFSNIFQDQAPGVPAGGLRFTNRGSKMSVGFLPAPNQSLRHGVVLAGSMRC